MTRNTRGYTSGFVQAVNAADPAHPGVRLAKLCIKLDVPIASIAPKLGVTRATIYNWAIGKYHPTREHLPKIERLMNRLSQA